MKFMLKLTMEYWYNIVLSVSVLFFFHKKELFESTIRQFYYLYGMV